MCNVLYIIQTCPDWETGSRAHSKRTSGPKYKQTKSPAAMDKKEALVEEPEDRETGQDFHTQGTGPTGIIPGSLLRKKPSPSHIEGILWARLDQPAPSVIEKTETKREGILGQSHNIS